MILNLLQGKMVVMSLITGLGVCINDTCPNAGEVQFWIVQTKIIFKGSLDQ